MSEKRYPTRMHEVLGMEPNEKFTIPSRDKERTFIINERGNLCEIVQESAIPVNRGSILEGALLNGIIRKPRLTDKQILDVTCGSKSIWFNKNNPNAVYCDIRMEPLITMQRGEGKLPQTIAIEPDVVCDFTNLPFNDNAFSLCVFDPPHAKDLSDKSWVFKKYGTLTNGWEQMLEKGFSECMRVLKPNGTLILKWADTSISTRDLINAIGHEPLFGHRSGKKMGTHWLTFMKLPEVEG